MEDASAGRTRSAYDRLRFLVARDTAYMEAHRELGLLAISLRQYPVARESLLRCHRSDPSDTLVLERLATMCLLTRQWQEAVLYGRMMAERGVGKRVEYLLGKSYWELEDYGNAFRHLDAAYASEPTNAEIPLMLARALAEMGNFRNAVKYYHQCIALDSSRSDWVYELALAYYAIPDNASAVRYFEKAIGMGYRVDDDVLENLTNAYIDAGHPKKAIELMQGLLVKRPGDLVLLYNLGDLCYRMREFDQAIGYWDRMLSYDPKQARALYMIGMSLQQKGEKYKGRMFCDKAIEMDPELRNFRQVKQFLRL